MTDAEVVDKAMCPKCASPRGVACVTGEHFYKTVHAARRHEAVRPEDKRLDREPWRPN